MYKRFMEMILGKGGQGHNGPSQSHSTPPTQPQIKKQQQQQNRQFI